MFQISPSLYLTFIMQLRRNIIGYCTSIEEELDMTFLLMTLRRSVLGLDLEEGQSTVFCRGSRRRVNFSPMDACLNQGREIFLLVLPLLGGFPWLPMELSWVVAIDKIFTCCFLYLFSSEHFLITSSHSSSREYNWSEFYTKSGESSHSYWISISLSYSFKQVFQLEFKLERYQKFLQPIKCKSAH